MQVSTQTTSDKVPAINQQATSGRKHPQHQQLLNNTMNLVESTCLPETSRGTLSKKIMKSTTLLKRT
jgi:hypothetical protein